MNDIIQRAWRAATFDRSAFGDWLYSSTATGDAALIVIAVALIQYVAALVVGEVRLANLIPGVISVAVSALAGWVFLGLATWFVGTRWFNGSGDMQVVLRMHGLAYLPNLVAAGLILLGGWGFIGSPIVVFVGMLALLWYLAAAIIGTSIGLSQSTRDGALSVVVGMALLMLVSLLFSGLLTGIGSLFGAVF
jgi:hypothetical protein